MRQDRGVGSTCADVSAHAVRGELVQARDERSHVTHAVQECPALGDINKGRREVRHRARGGVGAGACQCQGGTDKAVVGRGSREAQRVAGGGHVRARVAQTRRGWAREAQRREQGCPGQGGSA